MASQTPTADPLSESATLASMLRRPTGRWILAVIAVVLLALTFRPVVEGDGVGYYAYLHAWFVSHDLSFESEYAAAMASHVEVYEPWLTTRTAGGHLVNFFPVGAAVLAAPAYLIAFALNPSGEPQYSAPFVEAFTLASLFYCLIALAMCYRLGAAIVRNRRAALVGVAGGLLATPLFFYALSDPSYAHTFSVFCVSAFVLAWWVGPPKTYRGWLGLGVLGGLMAMTRFQDGALVALVLVDWKRIRWPALLFIPGFLLGFAPQLAVDQIQFGTWLPHRPPGQELNLLNGRFVDVLFSSNEGLFVWTPAALLAAAGIFLVRNRRFQIACAIAFLVEVLIIGSTPDSPGTAIGPRRFLELIPFAIVGLAALAARIGPRLGWIAVGALSLWNLMLTANFVYLLRPGDPGYQRLTIGQLEALPYLPRLFAKGGVVRDLVLWSQAHTPFDPSGGMALLALEALCVAAAVVVAMGLGRMRTLSSETQAAAQ